MTFHFVVQAVKQAKCSVTLRETQALDCFEHCKLLGGQLVY
jgi:hypothetical protein